MKGLPENDEERKISKEDRDRLIAMWLKNQKKNVEK